MKKDSMFSKDGEQLSIFDVVAQHNQRAEELVNVAAAGSPGGTTHTNSILSNRDIDRFGRNQQIMDVYRSIGKALTDRDVMLQLGFTDLNMVRPRITELIEAKQLEEVGTKLDAYSGRRVRLVTILGRR